MDNKTEYLKDKNGNPIVCEFKDCTNIAITNLNPFDKDYSFFLCKKHYNFLWNSGKYCYKTKDGTWHVVDELPIIF